MFYVINSCKGRFVFCISISLTLISAETRIMGLLGIITFFPPLLLVLMIMNGVKNRVVGEELTFDENYFVIYSQDHFVRLRGGLEVQLSLDHDSGLYRKKIFRFSYNLV